MTAKPRTKAVIAVLFLLSITSCGKKWIYFQEKEESSNRFKHTEVSTPPVKKDHVITSGDIIGITIFIAEADLSEIAGQIEQSSSERAIKGFVVDEDSSITHPLIGNIGVGGLTLAEASDRITELLSKNYKSPVVTVTLNGYRVTILGEIGRPGVHYLNGSHVNIIDAIATAGDLKQYGDPSHVKVIRNVDGNKKIEILDLTDLDVFKHPYYYLQSNDIVYIGGLPRRVLRENITLITSLVTVINSIAILSIRFNQR